MSFLVQTIGHVQLNVTDPKAYVEEATSVLGLRVTHQSDDMTWLSSCSRKVEVAIHKSHENAVRKVGFEALSIEAVEAATTRVEQAGCKIVSEEPSLNCFAAGVTFSTPEGLLIEVHAPASEDINATRNISRGIAPKRMDHVNLTTPDPAETRSQFETIMGLRMSEKMVDDGLSWMRGGDGCHHCVGIVKGPVGLHHYSFQINNFSDYCRLGDRLDQIEKNFIWGPGRHRPGDNTFSYYIDTCGAMVECSGPMSIVADDDRFEPNIITALKRPDNIRVMNVWGEPSPLIWREHQFLWSKAT